MAIALGKGDVELAKSYTSTIYFTIGFISTLFLILGLFIVEIINWRNILNVSNVSEHVLKTIMDLMIIYLSVNLTFRVISSIFLAKQMPVMSGMINTATKLFIFIGLGLLLMFSEDSDLISYASLYLFTPIFVLTILSIYFYTHEYRELVPSWNNFDKNLIGDLLGLGGKFFVIQIGMTILFMSDNLIISKILGPAEVTPYQIANKYFGVALMIFTILMSPFWSAITDAYIKKDLRWIKNLIKKLNYGWMSVCIMVLIMFIFYNPVLKLWVGNKINIPVLLACQWAIFVILQTLNQIYTYFLNGTGKLALQMWSNLFTVILNIPLSIYFAKKSRVRIYRSYFGNEYINFTLRNSSENSISQNYQWNSKRCLGFIARKILLTF